MDDSFQPGAEPQAVDTGFTRARTGGGWSSLAGQEATRKENEQKAAKFKGCTSSAYCALIHLFLASPTISSSQIKPTTS